MRHFAFFSPPFISHIRALEAVAAALLERGHKVSWVHQADVGPLLQDPRIGFIAVGRASHPVGSLAATVEAAANPGGPMGSRRVIADVAAATDMLCREAPEALRRAGVDAVVADQMEAAGGLIAQALGLPFASVACALPVNREPAIPLPVLPWRFAESDPRALQINEGSTRVYDWLMRPHERVISAHAARWNLPPARTLADCLSPLAQVSQTTAGFDFDRRAAPAHFHPVGPLRPPPESGRALDLALDADRPFAFASLGTLQGGRLGLFKRIARACRAEGIQLLVAHCNRLNEHEEELLKRLGATAVVGFAPQRAAIARADVVITHAGLNTVMDALLAGKPMVALPIAFDQPGVAARVAHRGVGLRLLPVLASVGAMRQTLRRLLAEPGFAAQAAALGREVAQSGGAVAAADIIEAAVTTGRPVLRIMVQAAAPRAAAGPAAAPGADEPAIADASGMLLPRGLRDARG